MRRALPRHLPFEPGMAASVRAGVKTATTRTRRYGQPGDTLNSDAGPLRLIEARRVHLIDVARRWYRQEGFPSPESFLDTWRRLHPRTCPSPVASDDGRPLVDRMIEAGFPMDQLVWLHIFEPVTP